MKYLPFFLLILCVVACQSAPSLAPTPTVASAENEFIEFESLIFPGHPWTPFMPSPEEGVAIIVSGELAIPLMIPTPRLCSSRQCLAPATVPL